MTDVSVDMTANGFDASDSFTLDRTMAEDMVPVADPGLDRPSVSSSICSEERLAERYSLLHQSVLAYITAIPQVPHQQGHMFGGNPSCQLTPQSCETFR